MNTKKKVIQQSAITHLNTHEYTYTWTIKDFEFLANGPKLDLYSPPFVFGNHSKCNIVLNLVFDASHKDYDLKLRFSVEEGANVPDYNGYVTVSIVDGANAKITKHKNYALSLQSILRANDKFVKLNSIVYQKHLVGDDKQDILLSNGSLVIVCDVQLCLGTVNFMHVPSDVADPNEKLLDDFQRFIESDKFSDVTLKVGDKTFFAHKLMLAARSSVFAASFEHDFRENSENAVEIDDIKADVMREVLRFIYVRKVENMQTIAYELLIAADKYDLKDLKILCENHLVDCLNVENAVDFLILADHYQANLLKTSALELILLHSKEIMKTEKFKKANEKLKSVFGDYFVSTMSM